MSGFKLIFGVIIIGLVMNQCIAQPADNASVKTIIRPDEPGIPFILDVSVQEIVTRKPIRGATVFTYQFERRL